jgi:hypothetical protein
MTSRQTITVSCFEGPRCVAALVLGPLAVHPDLEAIGTRPDQHTVTHVPTGRKLAAGLTRHRALALAGALLKLRVPWRRLTENTSEQYSAVVRPVIDRLGGPG